MVFKVFKSNPQNSAEIFKTHWMVWKLLGAVPNSNNIKIYRFYAITLNLIFVIGYPLHLLFGLLELVTFEELCLNLTLTVPVIVCGVKFFNLWLNFNKIRQLEQMFNILQSRINQQSEWIYYREVAIPTTMNILRLLYVICTFIVLSWELTNLGTNFLYGWRLMSSGYFPFDPYATTLNFMIAQLFQIIGFAVQVLENLANDTYGGMCLALLAGHAHLLGKRVARIGYDESKTKEENTKTLKECIADHNMLFDCHRIIGEIISFGMFIQVIAASAIMGLIIIFMVFYVNNIFEFVCYGLLLFGCTMEVFPTCYYGTYFEFEFDKLTYMIFSCNWMDQSREFKRNLGIFVEQSLKQRNIRIGGMIRLNLNIFFSTCKGAYSLLALAFKLK